MTFASNLYAEKIYAEHPICLWALDDNADYVKMMTDDKLILHTPSTFTISNIASLSNITNFNNYQTPPISSAASTKITLSNTAFSSGAAVAALYNNSGTLISSVSDSFTISFYYYADNPYIKSIKVGYVIGSTLQTSETFSITSSGWNFITKSFDNSASDKTVKVYLEFNYLESPDLPGTADTYEILINGLSMGYRSEDSNKESAGISISALDTTLDTNISGFSESTYGYAADAYGISGTTSNGYYCYKYNKLVAKNAQVPMVFGSSNSTIIYPNLKTGYPAISEPSMIIPAFGFLNQIGKNKEYTFEFWLRARVLKNNGIQRIFGPVNSTDGIYVNKTSMVLKIGNKIGSYYVGEWYRPLLIDINYGPSTVTLLVNGEAVVSLSIETADKNLFPENKTSNKDNNWLAFYANESNGVASLEVDGIAIYPYQSQKDQIKRRYIFGQGVEFPQQINNAYHGKSFQIDYDAANYANNYKHPGINKWKVSAIDNFNIVDGTLSTPTLSLPEIKYYDEKTYDKFYSIQSTTSSYIINGTISSVVYNGYLVYDSIDILNNVDVRAFVLSVRPTSYVVGTDSTIFKLVNKNTGDYVVAKLVPTTTTSATMIYKYKIGDSAEQTLDASLNYTVATTTAATVGFDIPTVFNQYASQIGSILTGNSNMRMYIGNDENFTSAFIGTIHQIAFASSDNFTKTISSIFTNGIATNAGIGRSPDTTQTFVTGFSYSYELLLKTPLGGSFYKFDIGASSNWQDYVPVQTLSKYTTNGSAYELDFIQFNVDYPEPCAFTSGNYDTSGSDIKTYIYFRYISSGSYVDASTLTSVSIPSHGAVVPTSSWKTQKYEVVNGAIVYLPSNYLDSGTTINDLCIGIVVQSNNETTILSPTKIRSLELAAQAVDTETEKWKNPLSTKFAEPIYPYSHATGAASTVFNYKDKNPYKIYKGNTPFLYLTRDSGIRVLSEYSNGVSDSRGFFIPINEKQDTDFNLSSLQIFARYENTSFPTSETKVFSINYITYVNNISTPTKLDFYIIAIGNTGAARRAKMYAKIGSTEYKSINYYINGVSTANPVLTIGEWSNIGIEFPALIDIDGIIGSIDVVGGLTINNVSYYQYPGIQNAIKYANQKWYYYLHTPWRNYVNLIPVSNFENISTNWIYSPSGGGTGTLSTVTSITPKYGAYALQATSTSGTGRLGILHNGGIISVTPGLDYTYSIYVKDGTSSESFISYIEWRNGATVLSTTTGTTTIVNTSDWTRVSVTATAPASSTNVRVYTYSATAPDSIGVYAYFDAALFQQGSSANQYYDSWQDMLNSQYLSVISINPGDMYDTLIGTNKKIMDNTVDEGVLKLKEKSKKIIMSTTWQDFTKKPA
jgi:hypothetical protein